MFILNPPWTLPEALKEAMPYLATALGQDAGAFLGRDTGVAITADLRAGLSGADVLIDFTRPEGTLAHLAVCQALGVRAVIGTTGFTPAQKAEVAAHAQRLAIVLAPNMSVGVNVMLRLLDQAADDEERIDRLVEAVGPASAGHQPPGELVYDHHLSVLHHVIHVFFKHVVRP